MTTRPDPDTCSTDQPVAELSAYDEPAVELTTVNNEECLYCYLVRMLDAFGCSNTHLFTLRWIDGQQRRHKWVLRWAKDHGGYCDCEVVFNTFRDDLSSERHRRLRCPASYLDPHTADLEDAEPSD